MSNVQRRLDALRCLSNEKGLAAYSLHLSTYASLADKDTVVQPGACHMLSSALARGLVLSVNDITAVLQSNGLSGGLGYLMTQLDSVISLSWGPQPEACSRSPVALQLAKVVAASGNIECCASGTDLAPKTVKEHLVCQLLSVFFILVDCTLASQASGSFCFSSIGYFPHVQCLLRIVSSMFTVRVMIDRHTAASSAAEVKYTPAHHHACSTLQCCCHVSCAVMQACCRHLLLSASQ